MPYKGSTDTKRDGLLRVRAKKAKKDTGFWNGLSIFVHLFPIHQKVGMNEIRFTKMHGAGNDYIYIDCTASAPENPSELAIEMSRRRFSVGADGIILIYHSEVADLRMEMYNADGSEGRMCGNASRCIGKYAYEHRLVSRTSLTLETLSGIKHLELHLSANGDEVESVTVNMGRPAFGGQEIPVASHRDTFIDGMVELPGEPESPLRLTAVSMGNPHGVVFIDHSPTDREVLTLGPKLERHPMWPERANIEFARVVSPHKIVMRVWERGSGETWACGTGACAVAAAAVATGRCSYPVTVELRGGKLLIDRHADGSIMMDGPAEEVYSGIYRIKKRND